MSRSTTISAIFLADTSDVDAKLAALTGRAQTPIKVPIVGDPTASPGGSTLGGMSVPSSASAPVPWGASSANPGFFTAQLGQQMQSAMQQMMQGMQQNMAAMMQSMAPASSPNWSNYFGGIQNQLQSMVPTSSPNWSYYASIAAGQGGGGGAGGRGGGRPGPAFGFFRPLAAGYFAVRGLQSLVQQSDRGRDVDESLARGDIDEALSSELAEAKKLRSGFTGIIRRGENALFQLGGGDDRYDDEAGERETRQGIASRSFEKSLGATVNRRLSLDRQRRSVGAGAYERTVIEADQAREELITKQEPSRSEVTRLRNLEQGSQAQALENQLNNELDAQTKLNEAKIGEAARIRGLDVIQNNLAGRSALLRGRGEDTLAQGLDIVGRGFGEIQNEKDPIVRSALVNRFAGELGGFAEGTRRQIGFNIDDARNDATVSNLRASRDNLGAERAQIEGSRRAALRVIPDNPIANFFFGTGALRDAVNAKYDSALGEVNARDDFETGTQQRSLSSQNDRLYAQLSRNSLGAYVKEINARRDAGIRALTPENDYLEGSIRTRARRERKLAIRDEAETRGEIAIRTDGQGSQIDSLLRRDPLGAELTGIRYDTALAAAKLRSQGRGDDAEAVVALGKQRAALARREFADRGDAISIRLNTENRQLGRAIAGDPTGADVEGIVGGAIGTATNLRNQGFGTQSTQALLNGVLQLNLTQRNRLRDLVPSSIDTRFNNDISNDGPTFNQQLGEIAGGRAKLGAAAIAGLAGGAGAFFANADPTGLLGSLGGAGDADKGTKPIVDKLEDVVKRLETKLENLVSE